MHQPLSLVAAEWLRTKERLRAEFPELEQDLETFADTLDGEAQAMDVIAGLVRWAREDDAHAKADRVLADDYAERARYLEARSEKRKAAALQLMEAIGEKTLRRPEFTLSVVNRPPKLGSNLDEAQIPDRFFDTKRVVNRVRLVDALREGEQVSGAYLTNSEPSLTVRMK